MTGSLYKTSEFFNLVDQSAKNVLDAIRTLSLQCSQVYIVCISLLSSRHTWRLRKSLAMRVMHGNGSSCDGLAFTMRSEELDILRSKAGRWRSSLPWAVNKDATAVVFIGLQS